MASSRMMEVQIQPRDHHLPINPATIPGIRINRRDNHVIFKG
jgi:hypothetical protein